MNPSPLAVERYGRRSARAAEILADTAAEAAEQGDADALEGARRLALACSAHAAEALEDAKRYGADVRRCERYADRARDAAALAIVWETDG